MSTRGSTVKSGPTKDFFISMITRDISLTDAIIELIDNCIDGIKRLRSEDFRNYYIRIEMNKDRFTIQDNCGGIDIDIAQNYAFKFGRPSDAPNSGTETTGTFGIGMKRALFKMGKRFNIQSTSQSSSFTIAIDVPVWAGEENTWDFNFSNFDENKHESSDCGTIIEVDALYPGVSVSLGSIVYINEVIQKVRQRASYEIQNGLQVFINSMKIDSQFIKLIYNTEIKPYKQAFLVNNIEVLVIAGIAPETDPALAGWYIYCNNREIVAADKTSLTTWNDGENIKYHNDYAAFRGFVFFNSKSPELLPWNTSKTGIDTSSDIYHFARQSMVDAFKAVTAEIKKIYAKEEDMRTAILQELKVKPAENINYFSAKLLANNTIVNFVNEYKLDSQKDPDVRISYSRPKSQVETIKKMLNVSVNKDVGIKTFEYFVEMEGLK